MDKAISKELFTKYGIPTPKGITICKGDRQIVDAWSIYPCIVKVNCGGSSVGVYMAEDKAQLEAFSQSILDEIARMKQTV